MPNSFIQNTIEKKNKSTIKHQPKPTHIPTYNPLAAAPAAPGARTSLLSPALTS